MAIIGITGGIASGKSTFTRALAQIRAARIFDSDACARELLDSDSSVRDAVIRDILPTAYRADGKPDRAAIRAIVFSDPAAKARLEAILHPLVRARRQALAEDARSEGRDLLVDIPLLFETGASSGFDLVVTVACSQEIQTRRAMSRGLTLAQVQQIVASQWGNAQKIAQSDFVVWNDGSLRMLQAQAEELAARLEKMSLKIKPSVS
ncbi:MAG: dephospho-CoA kinase [Spartobacteria bacterium]